MNVLVLEGKKNTLKVTTQKALFQTCTQKKKIIKGKGGFKKGRPGKAVRHKKR